MELENVFYIQEKDWYKLQAWATIAYDEDKNEISGLMTAIPQEDGRIKISDVEILKQENSATNTELDGDSVADYMMRYGMKYNNPNMKFVWWHSHHTMGAFWSGTDEKEIDAWKNSSYSLALVINLREEYKFRVSFWQMNGLPIEQHIDTNLTIEREQPKVNITSDMKKQYKELCEERTIIQSWVNHNAVNVRNGYLKYNGQTNIWENEKKLLDEGRYNALIDDISVIQDSFLDGTSKIKEFRNSLKIINNECIKQKYPFKIDEKYFKLKKAQLIDVLMEVFPSEFFQWKSEEIQDKYERNSYIGGLYGV